MDGDEVGLVVSDGARVSAPDGHDEFSAWVSPHLQVMVAVAARQVGASDADDVVQEALVRAWSRRSTYRAESGSVRAWLLGVLLDQCRRHRRGVLRRGRRDSSALGLSEQVREPGMRIDVERLVAGLPRRQREAVVLHYLADLSVTEVAKVLGVGEGSVKRHLFDARAALRQKWERS